MARRFQPQSTPDENLRVVTRSLPWKLLVLIPILLIFAVPAYLYALHLGNAVLPGMSKMFYTLSAPAVANSTPLPAYPAQVPQPGSLLYTVGDGDSCDSILADRMHLLSAGEVFSDVKPDTVKALNASLGQDCHRLQSGIVLPLSPQYPLVALGGKVLKIDATSPHMVLPTPLIHVPNQPEHGPDCSGGCSLTVQVAPQVVVHLIVKTELSINIGSWVWTQALLARKPIRGFDTYPYVDSKASINGMTLRACDFQVDDTYDDNSPSCSQILPNTILVDQGAWIFAVTGTNGLGHWRYPLHLPTGSRVLLWLSLDKNGLNFRAGNAVYRYDDAAHVYVKV